MTDKVFEKITKNIGAEWRQLGISLRLTHPVLDKLEINHPDSIIDCITAMLEQWRGDPVTDPSLAVLRTALVDVGRRDLADFIATVTQDNGKLFNKTQDAMCVCHCACVPLCVCACRLTEQCSTAICCYIVHRQLIYHLTTYTREYNLFLNGYNTFY